MDRIASCNLAHSRLHCPPKCAAARAAWSFTHGLTSLVIHGVSQVPPDLAEGRFLHDTLQAVGHLVQRK